MRRFFNLLLLLIVTSSVAMSAHAADLKVEALLIWGANNDPDGKLELVDTSLANKLHRMFKWNNYFEITNTGATVPLNQSREIKMSKDCTIRIKNVGGSRVELSCIGKGKQVHKGAYTLIPPKWLVLGGNDSADTAWFIGLRAVDPKADKKAVTKN